MIKRNQWYKLTESEFTDILRFVDKNIANNQKYIESLNRVGDAYSKYKVLYVQLQYHHFPSQGLYNKFYAWHYRSSYSEYYCGQCLEYIDIVFDKCCDAIDAAKYALKCCEKDAMFYANWDTNATKKIIENKEEKVIDMDKSYTIRNIIENYVNDCEKEYRAQYETKVKLIKADDEMVKAAKVYLEVLNKNREPNNLVTLEDIYCPTTEITNTKIKTATNEFDDKIRNLHKVYREAENLCNLCDTYEQMRQVLADYDIIPNTKKRGK